MKLFREIFKFIMVLMVFFAVTSPFVALFGPFDNIKRTVVGAILKSRHPQYITWLFSQEEIDAILGGISTAPKQELFKFTSRSDSSLKLKNIDSSRFKGFLLEIPDPKRVEIATAANLDEKGDTTSGIAKRNNAVAAINAGGFYDANGTGTGRSPYGFIIHDSGFILGKESDDSEVNEFVGFTKDGNLIAGNYSKGELVSMGVKEGITFGPPLVVNGEKMITSGDGGWGVGPRTAIGQRKDGTVLFLVIDGRQPSYSIGATLRDLQNIMYEEGAYIAANLDGGSSSTLYLNGEVVNKPADLLGERMIPTAFIVK
ncbi:phosphodiester glycosidase family protein [Megasphaera vaginalis (ex Srinivasan et al. 2021)]|uniref:Periplasmic protein, PF09992 family n=1 Tax=Megasphaera vaginalis (ex Srinivasan et al. 2021) TaxID=1111454 RepID=U7UK40_9FIRM|nr:phosphodiester glycosidase family protein [Megasphaera vaginalis (ex Srinivasan et al. 2021)]ERT59259.1 periplasmic protein, PF09992 family [Megasphaera vaginalis (ex Srinivasan et al. 2021)]